MDIVMTGRNVDVPAHYRVHVTDKLAHLERLNNHPIRYDVELDHENNPRQSKTCQRVEITSTGNGPTMRAEASGPDFYTALDAALSKLKARLRRSHDRRRVHHGRHQTTSVATAAALFTNPGAHQHTTTNPLGRWEQFPTHPYPYGAPDTRRRFPCRFTHLRNPPIN